MMDAATLHDLQVRAALGDYDAAHALRAEYTRRDASPLDALDMERRYALPNAAAVAKAEGDAAARIIEGYASTFENEARADSYGDIVSPGAFAEALTRHAAGERRVRFLYQHDMWTPIGRPEEMREDTRGLWTKSYVSQTQKGEDALTLARDEALDSFSIGFYVRGYEIIERPDGSWLRKLTKIDLWEYSLVTFPANIYARIQEVRSARASQPPPTTPNTNLANLAGALDSRLARAYADIHLSLLMERTSR